MKKLLAALLLLWPGVLVAQTINPFGEETNQCSMVDGVSQAIRATILDLTNSNPLMCAISDGSGSQITSFGGGTQYTEGDTDATITGTAMLWEDAADTLRAVSSAKPLPITCISGCGGPASFADNSAFTFGTTSIGNIGAVVDDVAVNTVAENSAGTPRMNTNRILYSNLRNNAGTELGTGSTPVRVDPTGGTVQPVNGMVTADQGASAATTAGWSTKIGNVTRASASWTSATAVDTTTANFVTTSYPTVAVTINAGSTITGGGVFFEVSDDTGTTWFPAMSVRLDSFTAATTYTFVQSTKQAFQIPVAGYTNIRVRLNPVITGTGTVVVAVLASAASTNPNVTVGQATAASLNATVNVSQFGGSNVATGTGAGGAGIPRVTISNDSSLAANQSVNLAQVGGTNTVNGGVAGTLAIGGTAGNNAAITQNPDLIGVEALSTQPAAATTGNQRRLVGSLDGSLYVRQGGPVPWSCSLDNIGATLTQCKAATGAGIKAYVTDIVIASTTATAGQFIIRTGTGSNCGTGTASLFPSAATVVRFPYPGNTSTIGSTTIHLVTPLNPPAASAICILCVATNTCTVQMQGYEAP